MPPKTIRVPVERSVPHGRRLENPGFFTNIYNTLTAPEYASVVGSVAAFGVGVAFLASPLAELLLPPQ